MKIIAVANHKGGAGKTTTAMLLADALQQRAARVLVLDTDPQASAWKWQTRSSPSYPRFPVSVEKVSGLSREAFAKWLKPVMTAAPGASTRPDYLVIDTPPHLDSEELFSALYICDVVLVPFRPHVAFVDALEDFVRLVRQVDALRAAKGRKPVQCRALLNGVTNRRRSERLLIEAASRVLPWPILNTRLKDLAAYADAFNYRTSVGHVAPARQARAALQSLVDELAL